MFAFKALLVMLIMAFAAIPVTIASRLIAAGGLPAGGNQFAGRRTWACGRRQPSSIGGSWSPDLGQASEAAFGAPVTRDALPGAATGLISLFSRRGPLRAT